MKTIATPGLKARMVGLHGWYSTHILGNRDGEVPGSAKGPAPKVGSMERGSRESGAGCCTLRAPVHLAEFIDVEVARTGAAAKRRLTFGDQPTV